MINSCTCTTTACSCYLQQGYDDIILWRRVSGYRFLDVLPEKVYQRIDVDFDPNRPASARRPRPWVLVKMKLPRSKRDPRPQSRGPGAHRRPCY